MIKKCIGCGSILQSIDKELTGFTPLLKNKYCMRCFKLRNYNEKKDTIPLKDMNNIIDKINKDKIYTFFLVDSMYINYSIINIYNKIKSDKCIILTKIDLIKKYINIEKYIDNIKDTFKINDEIYYISNKDNLNTKNILKYMDINNIDKTYIVGNTNVGKSSLINRMLDNNDITVSKYKNTTLDIISLRIDGKTIYDTPGFNIYDSLDISKNLNIKVRNLVTKDITNILINNKYFIGNFGNNNITFYIFDDIKITKVYKDSNNYTYLDIKDNSDLIIYGIGFIKIKIACKIKIDNNLLDYVYIRRSLV